MGGYLANVLASFPKYAQGLVLGPCSCYGIGQQNTLPPTRDEEAIPLAGDVFINPVATTLLLWCQPTELKGFTAWRHPALVRRTAPIKAKRKEPAMLKKIAYTLLVHVG